MNPVLGRDRVARLMFGLFTKGKALGARLHPLLVNGQPGAMIFDAQDRLINVFALDISDGVIRTIRSVINPDKLHHLGPLSDIAFVGPWKPKGASRPL